MPEKNGWKGDRNNNKTTCQLNKTIGKSIKSQLVEKFAETQTTGLSTGNNTPPVTRP